MTPSAGGEKSDATDRTKPGFDAVTFLTIYLFLFTAIPSNLTIPALGSIGRLSVLWGLFGIIWWAFYRAQLTIPITRRANPVKIVLLIFLSMLALSYAIANLRGIPTDSATTADSSLLRLASWAGVALVAMDGIRGRDRLHTLLRRMAVAGALMALLGIAQFITKQSLVDAISLPGFAVSDDTGNVQVRGDFTRAAGTARHPLEYASMLCATLPLALGLIATDKHKSIWRRTWPALVITIAVVLSVSRSALIGVFVSLLLFAPGVPKRYRLRAVAGGIVLVVIMAFAVPGLMGTVRGMFLSIDDDPSALSRTNSRSAAILIALRNPFFGQGFGTFQPWELVMDNQYLTLFIDGGFLGVLALLTLVVTAMVCAWSIARKSTDAAWRIQGFALAAGVGGVSVMFAFFDGFAFPITSGILFLLLGIIGAMARLRQGSPETEKPGEATSWTFVETPPSQKGGVGTGQHEVQDPVQNSRPSQRPDNHMRVDGSDRKLTNGDMGPPLVLPITIPTQGNYKGDFVGWGLKKSRRKPRKGAT
ncbi:O-antigen ligase [Arthrobacter sp. GMC3]|uniref:O-antigen ligase family protein n=1 Tax=Arthrobacter sp. GMC3 TaxID=2058894 RepID=UPI000CE5106C|nr:O-antigen ligase family protein [Arthrobacter sp. GMC3]